MSVASVQSVFGLPYFVGVCVVFGLIFVSLHGWAAPQEMGAKFSFSPLVLPSPADRLRVECFPALIAANVRFPLERDGL